jgi:hypothetical protein
MNKHLGIKLIPEINKFKEKDYLLEVFNKVYQVSPKGKKEIYATATVLSEMAKLCKIKTIKESKEKENNVENIIGKYKYKNYRVALSRNKNILDTKKYLRKGKFSDLDNDEFSKEIILGVAVKYKLKIDDKFFFVIQEVL